MFDELLGRKLCDAGNILQHNGYRYDAVLTKAPGVISVISDDSRVLRVKETASGMIELIICNPLSGDPAVKTTKAFQGDTDAAYFEKVKE